MRSEKSSFAKADVELIDKQFAPLGDDSLGGRETTKGRIEGRFGLSVGMPTLTTPAGWRWVRLTDVARLETGHTPSRQRPEYWDGPIPWIGIKDAGAHHGGYIEDTTQHITQEGLDNSAARLLPAGTVCLSRTASIGYICIMQNPMATSQDFVNWVCSDQLNNRYLLWLLLGESDSLHRFASGTTHQTIYFPEVKAFHVCIPHRKEQDRIAAILGSLDDKIELNRHMNETLEAMARSVFRSWFVDFDPVRAKADGRVPFGMDADTAALFPDRFTDSALGHIPIGWTIDQIGRVTRCVGGTTPSTDEPGYWGGNIAFATPKDLSNMMEPFIQTTGRSITQAGLEQISSGLLPRGTVLLSSRAPIGYIAIADMPVAVNQGFIAMFCDGVLPNYYVLNWTRDNLPTIIGRANGTTFLEISKTNFRPIDVIVPPAPVLTQFVRQVEPLYHRIAANLTESRTLAAIRDSLLPRLLSGELRVPDAEAIVEAAT